MDPGETADPGEEGIEAGNKVRLPRGASEPIRVYINGIEQQRGPDYRVEADRIIFSRPIIKEGKLSGFRWLVMAIGLFGSYRKNETVDISYVIDGRTQHVPDVPILSD